MASLVLGVAGAVVGSFFGMPQLGWAIGSALAGSFFGAPVQHPNGPRLGDLKVQASNYGIPVPKVYGTTRLAGNMIWAADIKETVHYHEEEGGKGGDSVEWETYTYSQSLAVGICIGEVKGIVRIWMNGDLAYSVAPGVSVTSTLVSSTLPIVFYPGSNTQEPDSTIQSHIGIADTPAYRGIAYVVFTDLQLVDYGNKTPNIEFEVVSVGTPVSTEFPYETVPQNRWFYPMTCITDPNNITAFVLVPGNNIKIYEVYNGKWVFKEERTEASLNFSSNKYLQGWTDPGLAMVDGSISKIKYFMKDIFGSYSAKYSFDIPNANNDTGDTIIQDGSTFYYAPIGNSNFNSDSKILKIKAKDLSLMGANSVVEYSYQIPGGLTSCRITTRGDLLYILTYVANVYSTITIIDKYSFEFISSFSHNAPIITTGTLHEFHSPKDSDRLFVIMTNSIDGLHIRDITNPATFITYIFPLGIGGLSPGFGTNSWVSSTGTNVVTQGYSLRNSTFIADQQTDISSWGTSIPIAGDYLSNIIEDICIRAGLQSNDIDTSSLSGIIVDGYITQYSTARAQLEQLLQAFLVDCVESSGKIKFVKRGSPTVLVLSIDELGASVGSELKDSISISRAQEQELPTTSEVHYADINLSYQASVQIATRSTIQHSVVGRTTLAISMGSSYAKNLAEALLYDAWASRRTFKISLTSRYLYLEPTDVLLIQDGTNFYSIRLTGEEVSSGLQNYSAVEDSATVYLQSAISADILYATEELTAKVPSNVVLLDIPLLPTTSSSSFVLYSAILPNISTWRGSLVYRSIDNGLSYSREGPGISTVSGVGRALSTIQVFTGGNIFDELSQITVEMPFKALSSITQLQVLNGGNAMLIGKEIIQFKNAELISTNTYKLTGLLRGRLGTEQHMGTVAIGDTCVLLTSGGIGSTVYTLDSLNVQNLYKCVTFGLSLGETDSIAFTYTGVSAKPYSPVLLGGGRHTSTGDITINWVRRARLNASWVNSVDVPLGETSELYDVEIYSDNSYTTLKRTVSNLDTSTTVYTSAMQVTDFGSNQATIYFKVYQRSALVGRGFEAKGQL